MDSGRNQTEEECGLVLRSLAREKGMLDPAARFGANIFLCDWTSHSWGGEIKGEFGASLSAVLLKIHHAWLCPKISPL